MTMKQGMYRCPLCGMAFYTRGGLDQHFIQNPKCKERSDIQLRAIEIYEDEYCPGGYSVTEKHKWELEECQTRLN